MDELVEIPEKIAGLNISFSRGYLSGNSSGLFDAVKINEDETAIIAVKMEGRRDEGNYGAAMAKLSIKHHIKSGISPASVLRAVNEELFTLTDKESYFRVFLGIIDHQTNAFRYSTGGLSNVSATIADVKLPLLTIGGHLALFRGWQYGEGIVQLSKSDKIELQLSGTRFKMTCTILENARKRDFLTRTGISDSKNVKVTVIHDFDEMKVLIRFLTEEADRYGYHIKFQKNFRLVLLELLTNAIIHGNKHDPNKKVVVVYDINLLDIRIGVIDEGEGYNPSLLPNPLAPENINKPHGRGIYLIRHYSNSFTIKEKGNITTVLFIKKGETNKKGVEQHTAVGVSRQPFIENK